MFRFSLQAVLDARCRAEEAARIASESSGRVLESQRAGLAGLHAHRDAVLVRLRSGEGALAPYLESAEAALRAADQALERSTDRARRAERTWLQALRDRRVMERFRDRERGRFESARERAETAEIDDANARIRNASLTPR